MSVTKKEFDVLTLLERDGVLDEKELDFSGSELEKTIELLNAKGYILDGKITSDGLTALEPYRVKRAVLTAAGFGSRMVPVTLKTPKPLVKVNGVRIIDTILDAVLGAGITDIYIVRGYKAEAFDELLEKYPMVKFVENPLYDVTNNISSGYAARHLYANSYILEADMVIYNPKIISKYQYRSCYMGIYMEYTDDWYVVTNEEGVIVSRGHGGGRNCYQGVGIYYWTEEDGKRLENDIKQVFENVPESKNWFWGFVPLEYFKKEYVVYALGCKKEDIIEIDTFDELKAIDKSYENYKA